jgi:hypothetical protein
MALASALKKLEQASQPPQILSRGIAHLCIDDPLDRRLTDHESFWGDLFATHPYALVDTLQMR